MNRAIICFSFIAFATLSSVWGSSLQARVLANGGCVGPREFYSRIAGANKIQDASPAYEAEMPSPPEIILADSQILPIFSASTDLIIDLPAWKVEELTDQSLAVSQPKPIVPESIQTVQPTLRNKKAGRYTFVLASSAAPGIAAGTFPAISIDHKEKSGMWRKRTKTVAMVTADGSGSFLVNAEFKSELSTRSAVAIDFGDGNIAQIPGDVIAREGIPVTNRAAKQSQASAHPKKRAYAALEKGFIKKPSKSLAIVRRVAPIVLPVVAGLAIAGPIGAAWGAVPAAKALVTDKIQRVQRQQVQSSQDDEVAKLRIEVASLKERLDSLGQTEIARTIQGQKEEGQ